MGRLGGCELCMQADVFTAAVLCMDGVPLCSRHVRGDGTAVRSQFRLEADVEPVLRSEPRLERKHTPTYPAAATALSVVPSATAPSMKLAQPGPDELDASDMLTFAPVTDFIYSEVAATLKISRRELFSRRREAHFVLARNVSVFLLLRLAGLSYAGIARRFSMHHTTLLHGQKMLATRMGADPKLTECVHGITLRVGERTVSFRNSRSPLYAAPTRRSAVAA